MNDYYRFEKDGTKDVYTMQRREGLLVVLGLLAVVVAILGLAYYFELGRPFWL